MGLEKTRRWLQPTQSVKHMGDPSWFGLTGLVVALCVVHGPCHIASSKCALHQNMTTKHESTNWDRA